MRVPGRSGSLPGGADGVLQAKVRVPGVPGWLVPRARLDRRLDEGAAGSLTVVTGPPGAGKTMAVASWAAARRGLVAWVTLDEFDSRPRVFWATVVEALRTAGVPLRRVAAAPARAAAADHVFLLRLASELAVQDPPVVLVLDDLHQLAGAGLMEGLAYLLRNARSGLRLVVCSRADPVLPLHRYRLAGELTEIRAGELAFSVAEAGQLMAQHRITLAPATLELLTRVDEGWAAGLRLAALSLGDHRDPGQFIKELAAENSAITGYLVEEALNNQPAEVRDLLLKTSIVDRVSAGIAAELTGRDQGAGTLAELARGNAFVQPAGGGWYRYHSLFAEVLRLKLRLECPAEVPGLHRRAARWYQRNGLLPDAVRQATAAGDWPLAAGLAVEELAAAPLADPHGRSPLAGWFRQMPAQPPAAGPAPALITAALALADGQPAAAAAALDAAAALLDGPDGPDDSTGAPARLAAATLALTAARRAGDPGAAAAAAARLAAAAAALDAGITSRHPGAGAAVLAARGITQLWSGDLDPAAATLAAAAAAAAAGTPEHADTLGYLALLHALRGQLTRAAGLAAPAAPPPAHRAAPAGGAAQVALAWVHLERNQRHDAREALKRADTALRAAPDKLPAAIACLIVARYRLAEGRARAATEMITRARHGWTPPGWLDHTLTLLESRAAAAAGDTPAAVALATRADPATRPDAAITLAHAWLDAGDHHAAAQALHTTPDHPAPAPGHHRLDRDLADARLASARGDNTRARRSLHHALTQAEPEQLRLPFTQHAPWIHPLLHDDPHLTGTWHHLLDPAHPAPGPGNPPPPPATPVIVEQLSDREREVLTLLSAMLSTAEVASELYISVNTVKTHLKSIYRKLAATHRGEAVRRARQLELL